jgi:hypothetical protein
VVVGSERRSAEEDGMGFEQTMDDIARGVEIIGIVTLVLGLAAALVRAALVLTAGQGVEEAYRIVRTVFGRSILLGWNSWSPPTSSGPWPSSLHFRTSLSSG